MTDHENPWESAGTSSELLKGIFDSLSDGIVVLDLQGQIVMCNQAMGVLVDRRVEDLIGDTPNMAWGGRDWSVETSRDSTVARDNIVRPDGTSRVVSVRVYKLLQSQSLIVAVYRDITRKQREYDEMFRFLVENVNDGVMISRGDKIIYANKRMARILGYRHEQLCDIPKALIRSSTVKVTCSDVALETKLRRADGTELSVEIEMTNGNFRGEAVSFEVVKDISERKKNEQRANAFLDLGRQLNLTTTPIDAARVVLSFADKLIGWDACFIDLLHPYDSNRLVPTLYIDQIDGKSCEVQPPVMSPEEEGTSLRSLVTGSRIVLRDNSCTEPDEMKRFGDRTRRSMSLMFAPMAHARQVTGIISIQSYTAKAYCEDDLRALEALGNYCSGALARTRAQAELHESEMRYRQMFEMSSAMKLLVEPETGVVVDANAAACKFYGYSLPQLQKMTIFRLCIHPVDEILEKIHDALDPEKRLFECRQRQASGDIRDVENYISPLTIKERKFFHIIVQDVTDRKVAEERSSAFAELGKRLGVALGCVEAARVALETADRLIGWDACFLNMFAGEVEQNPAEPILLVPVIHCDTINGKKIEVEPQRTVLPVGSPTYLAMERGAQLILREPGDFEAYSPFGDTERPSASLLYVPVRGRSGVVGVLSIQSYNFHYYDENDLETLQLLADHCGGALERTRAEEMVRLLESAVRHASDMVIITVQDLSCECGSRIVFVNEAFEKTTGYTWQELLGKPTKVLQGPDTDKEPLERLKNDLLASRPTTVELVNYKKDGTAYHVEFSAFPMLDDKTGRRYFVSVQRDVTQRKQMEQQLIYRAFHDPLTHLANRNLFQERVSHAILRSQRSGETFAVLFLDVDNFKLVNDEFGHLAGDCVLNAIARRLETCVRPGDTIARLGGDEFTILLEGISALFDATSVAERILEILQQPIRWEEHTLVCKASIGIAMQSVSYTDPDEIVRDADVALLRAKGNGKSCYVVFKPEA